MKKIFIFIIISACFIACGGTPKEQEGIYPLTIEPNPATLASGVCTSHITMPGDLYENVTLITIVITITDSNNLENKVTFTDTDVEDLFGTIFLPQASLLEGDLTIDGTARGMSGNFEAAVVVIGNASNGYTRTWAGIFECLQ